MSECYKYTDKSTGEVVYVGVTGIRGRQKGLEGVLIRDAEHFSTPGDPLFESGYRPLDLRLEWSGDFSEHEALAVESLAIAHHTPKYNTAKNKKGIGGLYDKLSVEWTEVPDQLRVNERHTRDMFRIRGNGKTSGTLMGDDVVYRAILEIEKSEDTIDVKLRWQTIIFLLRENGITVRELRAFDVKDVSTDCTVITHGGIEYRLGVLSAQYLRSYMEWRKWLKCWDKQNPLFLSNRHKRISAKTIEWKLKSIGKSLGVGNMTPASLIQTYRFKVANQPVEIKFEE